jgi:hemolysin III
MFIKQRVPMIYSRAERVTDAMVHVAGLLGALVGVPVLITLAALWFGDAGTVIAAVVYGVSLLAMFTCSALYNMVQLPAWKDMLRRMDQSAIYVKIAGTYTPFAVLTGSHAGYLLTGIWGAALAGASMILLSPSRLRWSALALYLGIGWAALVVGGPMLGALSAAGFALILAAGSIYTLGVVFFLWERLPFHNTIWHVFVLAASVLLYVAVLIELWGRAPAA